MTESISGSRNAYWDNAKGILICLVVLGHYLYAYQSELSAGVIISVIYFFHMPAFALISGFFSKSEKSTKPESLIKIGTAYVIFNSIMMIYAVFFENSILSLVQPYNSYWYLIALLVWRLSVKAVSKIKGIIAVSIIAALLIGFWGEVSNVFALSRVICFYPFFLIGYRIPSEKINTFIENRKGKEYLKGILLFIVSIGLAFFCALQFYPSWDMFLMSAYESPACLLNRIIIFIIALLIIISLGFLIPGKSVPLINKWGRNSLTIYVVHRIITLIFARVFPASNFSPVYILFAVFASGATLLVLGLDSVSRCLNFILNSITELICDSSGKISAHRKSIFRYVMVLAMILLLLLPVIQTSINGSAQTDQTSQTAVSAAYPVLTDSQTAKIKNAVSIAFAGDLLLLQDQVKNAYSEKTGEYDFSSEFTYASSYLSKADLAIGVFEGPTAGDEYEYSTGNYDDGLDLSLNFPDSFAYAVKNAGFDFVTTANNHLLDKGTAGAMRTLDILDEAGLGHTGSYRNGQEKNAVTILNVEGLKIAVLAYTYGVNGYEDSYFLNENKDITSVLVDPSSQYFNEVKAGVIDDINRAKSCNPDVIIVLPHMGTQFSHETDSFQDTWDNVFIQAGADLILGDHSHAVQPLEFRSVTNENGVERQALIVHCPGNFVNSYTANDGDAEAITEIYLDPATGSVICAGIVPMWTQSPVDGIYRALPIYDIMTDEELRRQISTYDMERVTEVQAVVTSVMLGTELSLDQVQEQYYLFPEGYVRQPADALEISDKMKDTKFYQIIEASKTICFVGDSLTAGSHNGGYGWYEPLMAAFPGISVSREAWDGATTRTLLASSDVIAAQGADTYVIAVGTNDVRYRDKKECAMDADSYIASISALTQKIKAVNPSAQFVLISPWPALNNDPYSVLPAEERDSLLLEYGSALKQYCDENNLLFIDPAPAIRKTLSMKVTSEYLLDHIHPNAGEGITLYSQAVMEYGIS